MDRLLEAAEGLNESLIESTSAIRRFGDLAYDVLNDCASRQVLRAMLANSREGAL